MIDKDYFFWSPDDLLEITFKEKDDFLKIRETLTRIGLPSKDGTKLTQTCHIYHKRGRYYIVHFLEMFCVDKKSSTLEKADIKRRNMIALKLQEWGLIKIVTDKALDVDDTISMTIIPFKEKGFWELISKYQLGKS